MLGQGLCQLESNATSTEFFERIGTIGTFGIKDCCGRRKFLSRQVMVADNNINSFGSSISDLLLGFDPTIEGNDKVNSCRYSMVYPLYRNAISLHISVGDIRDDSRKKRR